MGNGSLVGGEPVVDADGGCEATDVVPPASGNVHRITGPEQDVVVDSLGDAREPLQVWRFEASWGKLRKRIKVCDLRGIGQAKEVEQRYKCMI